MDLRTKKFPLKTTIPMASYTETVDPNLEKNVQWDIFSFLKLEGIVLSVKNSKGKSLKLSWARVIGENKENADIFNPPYP